MKRDELTDESGAMFAALEAVLGDILRLVREDDGLRSSVRLIGRLLLDLTADEPDHGQLAAEAPTAAPVVDAGAAAAEDATETVVAADAESALPDAASPGQLEPATPAALPAAPREDLKVLIARTLAANAAERERQRQRVAERSLDAAQEQPHEEQGSDEALPRLITRLRVRGEAARWVGTRQRLIARQADWDTEVRPGDKAILEKARKHDVFVWMCRREAPFLEDPSRWDDLGGAYDALADGLALAALILEQPHPEEHLELALRLIAEAQSALRVAVLALEDREDDAQTEAYQWLKRTTRERQIYLDRHMRLADPADPTAWSDLRARIQDAEVALRAQIDTKRKLHNEWGRLRYHLKLIARHPAGHAPEDWAKAMLAVESLTAGGIAPSNVALRDTLLPYLDALPDDLELGPGATLVLREIDRYQAAREAEATADAARNGEGDIADEPSPDVAMVAELLRGRAMVLIGGLRRPHHARALEAAFGLSELLWLDGGDPSPTQFEPAVARPDVALVVLMIRWSSHSYGDVKIYCEKYGKPLVRVPAGYNPNQIALQIRTQVGERLERMAAEELGLAGERAERV